MSFEADFRTFLLSAGGVSSRVVDRVTWGELPDAEAKPSISLWTMDNGPDYVMQGASGLEQRRVQVDCWSMTLAESVAIADAIAGLIDGFRGTVGATQLQGAFVVNRSEERDPAIGAPAQRYARVRVDLLVWYGRAG